MSLEKKAIERIRAASDMSLQSYGKPLVCTYSGGKDSDVLLELFVRSGINFEVHNSHTTVDAPQTVYHIRRKFRELELKGIKCTMQRPDVSMWNLIPLKKTPPTRTRRYCCSALKETHCGNRMIATGVRWQESNQRKERGQFETINPNKNERIILMNDNDDKRKFIERCTLQAKTVVNPIIDWEHHDIWDFINSEKILVNILYYLGYDRVGCIGCPNSGNQRYQQFADFPTYKRAYKRAFAKMLERIPNPSWQDEHEVYDWWMEDKQVPGQLSFDDLENAA